MHLNNAPEFGKWRSLFWPIHREELKKFLPLFLMFGLIAFNYSLLRAYKDSMVVTAHQSGAETIPFIKVWVILPSAVLMTFVFTRLSNRFSREKVFYIMMFLFLAFFFIFTFFLFPAQKYLHPNQLADLLQVYLPPGCKGFIALFRNWTFTLFYVMSELWSSAILSVLFWGFTNEVTSVVEAKRFYGLLTIGGNIASSIAGEVACKFTDHFYIPWIPYGQDAWDQSVLFLNCAVISTGLITIGIFRWLTQHGIASSDAPQALSETGKVKISMRKSFAYLGRSKYLICIAAIVVAYNLAMNLIEVVWKNQIKQIYPNPNDYTGYMGGVMIVMGIIATIVGLFFTNAFIRRSWTLAAMIPAAIVLVTGTAFFIFTLSGEMVFEWGGAWFCSTTPLMLSITLGSSQQILARTCKYTLVDATKEIAFIPLSSESKLKGKAAIDGVGSRMGKSGGAVIHQGLLLVFSSIAASTPYVAAIFGIIILVWIFAVLSLGKQFDALVTAKLAPTP